MACHYSSSHALITFLLFATIVHQHVTEALPLSTNSRWIVDDAKGGSERVKLSCVNWVSHLEVVVAEGLHKQPVDMISTKILEMGFNCVRLTYPLFLFTNSSLGSVTVRQSLKKLGLIESIAGFQANNPSIIDLPLIKAFQEVVASLERNNVMVILDNQISKPGWCCSDFDGNGFFGDQYFDPNVWLHLIIIGLTTVIHHHHHLASAIQLSTSSRWIVNDYDGERVKLACVNWVSHLDAVIAEGLSKQPVDVISKKILEMGFNCVRLTYPLFLFTNHSLGAVTVRQSFLKLGLIDSIHGFEVNNPFIIDLPLIKAFQEVVASLDRNNVMVVLDNQISKPGWCCSDSDGNGFFGDQYFDPDVWLYGLAKVATMFSSSANVVGMSLRNELRGPKENVSLWYRYMQKGAEVVHAANPNVLAILSGLSYDKDLSFLQTQPIALTFGNKLVFEVHWYGFSNEEDWKTNNTNQVCAQVVDTIMNRAGFLLDEDYPLFISEWGIDQRGTNDFETRYLNCFSAWAADHDLDWALWTLAGSYYFRQGVVEMEETYGLLTLDWSEPRNSSFLQKISPIQSPFQGPELSKTRPHKMIFHPATGLCVQRQSFSKALTLGPCSGGESWDYTSRNTITIKGTYYCLQADGVGKKAKLGTTCTDRSSQWEEISASKLHLSSNINNGAVCLDIDSENTIITNTCKCLACDSMCDPASQWFKIINATTESRAGTYGWINWILQSLGAYLLG